MELKDKLDVIYHETLGNDHNLSPEAQALVKREKALVRKLDLFIAPVMMLLMLISYLDRGVSRAIILVLVFRYS